MATITVQQAQAWGEKTKLRDALYFLDDDLLAQVESEVLGRVASVADTATWLTPETTPTIVQTVIAKFYVAWIIDRQYSEDEDLNAYAGLLRTSAQVLLDGILASEIDIPGADTTDAGDGLPSGYPTDTDPICGPVFRMDMVF